MMVRMDITPYVDRLREQLLATAAGASPEVAAAAERLTIALDPAVRLTMMEALAEASAEITRELPSGSVDVRLSGRSLDFIVELPATPTPPTAPTPPPPPTPPAPEDLDDGDVVRITLRLPENLKNRAEEQATKAGQSLNTWLVTAVRDAVAGRGEGAVRVDIDLSSLPFGSRGSRRMSGWA